MKPLARRRARERALQVLYAWRLSGNAPAAANDFFQLEADTLEFDCDYFSNLVHGVTENKELLDQKIRENLSAVRTLEQLDPIEHVILWIAFYESIGAVEVPSRVILNEAIELAKRFGAEASYRYINGVLHHALHSL